MKTRAVITATVTLAAICVSLPAWAVDPPQFVLQWGTSGSGPGEFSRPTGVGVDKDGNVYVADVINERIQKFTGNGTYILEWGTPGTGPGQFDYPRSPKADADGNIFVSDEHNHRMQKFTSEGVFLLEWGGAGSGDGQFYYPNGILVDPDNYVHVVSGYAYTSESVQKFASDGTFVSRWGSSGSGDGQFYNASGLAMDSAGNIYVADFRNNRIQKFAPDGTFIRKWGTPGSGNGQFFRPHEVEVDAQDYVYVCDQQNNRVQVFDTDGNFLTKWGSYGTGEGQFFYPMDIAVDHCGNIFVADQANDRIQKFVYASGNSAPTVSIAAPASGALFAIGETITFSGSFADDEGDIHTAQWVCGDLTLDATVDESSGEVSASSVMDAVGVHLIALTVTDQCGATGTATTVGDLTAMIVVYDPDAGFVTGGGWFDSPPGAYAADSMLTGKANFGFVSRYKKGTSVPSGGTEFRFQTASLDFHSTAYQWLVIAGARAQFKGVGQINGAGNYGFMISALDGDLSTPVDADRFRIKIVDKDQDDMLVYDNQLGAADGDSPLTPLGGGSIVIHSTRDAESRTASGLPMKLQARPSTLPAQSALFQNHPNPFNPTTRIRFALHEGTAVRLAVYDVAGRLVKQLVHAPMPAGEHHVDWDGNDDHGRAVASGVYFYRLEAGGFVATRRMVLLK